jgi:tetratricopeptide (TPR) repeat protein
MMLQKQRRPALQVALTAIILLSGFASNAQVLTQDLPENRPLIIAEEQCQQGLYSLAAQSARQYLNQPAGKMLEERQINKDKARYILALSSLKADIKGCVDSAKKLMASTREPYYYQRMAFALAQYYFQQDALKKAIPLYEAANINNLGNKEIADAKFELAYCYFNNREFDKAAPLFLAIKELKDGKYYLAGNYYYGLLAYNNNKYAEALKSFEIVKSARDYRAIVPYYIAEIYYFMGNRARAFEIADTFLKRSEKLYYDKELHLLAGQCMFEDQRYKDALPYFEYYYEHTDKIRKEDLYKIAYCYYRTNQWSGAIEKFKLLSNAHDSLGQTAMYLLGDCYLKTDDKVSARNAFGICADMTYNRGQQEASMILYGRLSYETGYNDEALRELELLLTTYPSSQFKDEANTLVSGLLIKTNHYEEALKRLDEVGVKDNDYWGIYQKAAFGYAIQQFRNGSLNVAYRYFTLSLQHPVNTDYASATYFWKSELAYRLHRYNEVISYAQDFLDKRSNPMVVQRISPLATRQHAYLNMGFASMETESYGAAQEYFNHAQQERGDDNYLENVAAVREADAVFMQKDYRKAIALYDHIIYSDTADADYARYQKSILLGLQGKTNEKISVLLSLINSRPPSAYANFARYEAAVTYIEDEKYKEALGYLQQLTDSIADKSFAPRSWMKTGFVYQQLNENSKAIAAYTHVVHDYPAAEDRMAALDALKSLYIQGNQPAAYTRLLVDNNLPSADSSSMDSTYYSAAESQFSNALWDEAERAFTNYLLAYPNGIFAVKAHYYRAESNFQLRKFKEAREDYDQVLQGQWNDFSENSARRAAAIALEQKDYDGAYHYYLRLRGNISNNTSKEVVYNGLMRSGFNSDKFSETVLYSDSLMALPGISTDLMNDALFYKARSLQHFDSADAAITIYKQLSGNKNGDIAAESRYHIAELLFAKKDAKEAEAAANEAIHLSAGYDYWIGKSYLLLADILVTQNDYFNAKALLQSIVKNTKIAEFKQEASKKLDEVRTLEKNHSKLQEDEK